ncbi:MAG: oligosaccharide flippase family protein [Rhodospirillaceae bacterium]
MKELGTVVRDGRIYLIANLAGRASAFALLPLYGNVLTPTEFGVMALLIMVNDLLGMVARMGMLQAMMRLYFDAPDQVHRDRVVATAHAMTLGMCLLILVLAWPVAQVVVPLLQIDGYATAAMLSLVMLAGNVLFGTTSNVFVIRKQPRLLVWTNVIKSLCLLVLSLVLLLVYDAGVTGAMLAYAVAFGLVAVGLSILEMRRSGLRPSRELSAAMLRFGLPLVPSAFANVALQSIDRVFLNILVGPAAVGYYALAGRLGHILQLFIAKPLSQVLIVRRFETLAAGEAQDDFHALQVLYLAILLLGALGLGLFGPELVWLLAAPDYAAAGPLIGVVALGYALSALNLSLETGLLYAKRTHLVSGVAAVMLVISGPLYWGMIGWLGLWGAALAFLALNVVRLVITDRLNASRGTPLIRQPWGRSLLMTGLVVAVYGGAMVSFGDTIGMMPVLVKVALMLTVTALILGGPFLEAATRTALWDLVRRRSVTPA